MITDLRKAPFPYYGGKRMAAPAVWAALGDVDHYVEPFMGSCAVLLNRPHKANRSYYSETVNDADGLLVNALRSMQLSPDAIADAASWYVSEADIMARHLAILAWAKDGNLERLMADPAHHDPVIAGWWLYGLCGWIGSSWCSGDGPWIVGADGRLTKRPKSGGANKKLPHLGDDGRGVNRPQLREPGVARQLPHISDNGRGVNHAGTREPGVARQLPHLGSNGQGVHRPQLREAGVAVGNGVDYEDAEYGLIIPDDLVFHSMTMPELTRWFQFLSARLRHVRIVNGDWQRVCSTGAMYTLPVRQAGGVAGVFLDPPYSSETARAMNLYTHESGDVAHAVRDWCLKMGGDPKIRIVLAGFDTEHTELEAHGWRVAEWFKDGFLQGGMANQSTNGHNQARERLWLSPHTLKTNMNDLPMFAEWENDDG